MPNNQKMILKDGFLVICTTCHGLAKEPAYSDEEANKIADDHLSLDSGHKSHAGHVVAIVSAKLLNKPPMPR
jgi:hypothetical protein